MRSGMNERFGERLVTLFECKIFSYETYDDLLFWLDYLFHK